MSKKTTRSSSKPPNQLNPSTISFKGSGQNILSPPANNKTVQIGESSLDRLDSLWKTPNLADFKEKLKESDTQIDGLFPQNERQTKVLDMTPPLLPSSLTLTNSKVIDEFREGEQEIKRAVEMLMQGMVKDMDTDEQVMSKVASIHRNYVNKEFTRHQGIHLDASFPITNLRKYCRKEMSLDKKLENSWFVQFCQHQNHQFQSFNAWPAVCAFKRLDPEARKARIRSRKLGREIFFSPRLSPEQRDEIEQRSTRERTTKLLFEKF